MIAALARQQPIFGPGVKWKYSNIGLSLAGLIVAALSGQPYAVYVKREIFDPLGMADSSLGLPADTSRFALAYGPKLPGRPQRHKRASPPGYAIGPAVDLCSTVLDLARFGMFQLRGRHAKSPTGGLDPITFGQMHRVHAISESWKLAFGLGFQVRSALDTTLVGHGGSHIGFRSQLDISVDDKLVAVVAANGDDVERTLYTEKALKLLVPHVRRLKAEAQKRRKPSVDLAKYVGRYRNDGGDVLILVSQGRLAATYIGGEEPEDHLIKLEPVAEHTFRIDDPFGGPDGELLTFDVDPRSGEVLGIHMAGTPRKRLPTRR
jgi:CubicO group peptidase (beta-lactamase class C family)